MIFDGISTLKQKNKKTKKKQHVCLLHARVYFFNLEKTLLFIYKISMSSLKRSV